jgi:hypothetical protein
MFKKSNLLSALLAIAVSTSSFAASASQFTINFDLLSSGANANLDQVATANGVSFASGHLADTLDANDNVIGQHWVAYSLVNDSIDPSIFAQNPSDFGYGAAPSGTKALDARFDQVLVQFANPTQLSSFSFNLDSSSYGNLQASNVLFLDQNGNTIFTSNDYFQASTTTFNQSFASSLTVSAVLLTSGKLYDNITIAAVPEADNYAMLLTGLGILGFMSRRRKNEQV